MAAILDDIPRVVQPLLTTIADDLARRTGFVRRERRRTGSAVAQAVCRRLIREPDAALADLAGDLRVSASAVCQRLCDPAAADFFRARLGAGLDRLNAEPAARAAIPLLRRFNGVCVTDATSVPLPPGLAAAFPGSGGGTRPGDPAAAAAAKVLVRWRLDESRTTDLLVDAATTPDLRLLSRLPDRPAGAPHVADLGVFDAETRGEYRRRGVSWLTRRPTAICVGAGRADRELADWLAAFGADADAWDGDLWVGKVTPVRARVIVRRRPPAVAAERRRKLAARASRRGRAVSARQLTLCDWWVLATAAAADRLSAAAAADLYRGRWQIELVFKRWKSLGRLAVPRHGDPARALATLYGLLLGLLVVDWLPARRGGALAARSVWRAWRIVRRHLSEILLGLAGVLAWNVVVARLADALDRRPKIPRRKKCPGTRQRLYRATLGP